MDTTTGYRISSADLLAAAEAAERERRLQRTVAAAGAVLAFVLLGFFHTVVAGSVERSRDKAAARFATTAPAAVTVSVAAAAD